MAREISPEEKQLAADLLAKARKAMAAIKDYDQAKIDRLCQAVGWATGNEKTFLRIAQMGVDESGIGDRAGRAAKRFKIQGVLRDALRQKSVGVIEVDEAKGLVKYGKPAGVIASLVPTTNPELTPPVTGIYALKAKDAVIFCPHPRSKKTTFEMVEVMRKTLKKLGAPEDIFQCVDKPSIPLTTELMQICDLTMATGGKDMVRAAYSSGHPAFGVGAGNSTIVVDDTANVAEAAQFTRVSKTSDFGSGCSADGNMLVDAKLYDAMIEQLQKEGGYLCNDKEKALAGKSALGRATATAAATPSPSRRSASPNSPASRFPTTASSSSCASRKSARSTNSLARSFASCWRCSSSIRSNRRSRWSKASMRSAAKGIPAASTLSTTSTSMRLPAPRRSAA